jgi:hypothetical protein
MRVAIEFSMAIGAVDFLLNEVFPQFKRNEQIFLENLKPFLLSEKLKNHSISDELLRKIVYYYRDNHNPDILEKIIMCLNFENEDMINEMLHICQCSPK